MENNNFKLGESVRLRVYNYDDQGTEYIREIKGKVHQITKNFVVIDNGYYKESFKYSEFTKCETGNVEEEPYDLSLESYSNDIVSKCINSFLNNEEGYVFNYKQLGEVINAIIPEHYITREKEGLYYIKKN